MKWNPSTRRHFLQGAGRTALALPVLPSLLSRKAEAQAAAAGTQKSFIGMPIYNHLQLQYNDSEAEARLTPSQFMPSFLNMQATAQASGRHKLYSKTLAAVVKDSVDGRVSEIIDASFNAMLPKMTFIQGMDYITSAHHSGHFGNGTACAPESKTIKDLNPAIVNIDQVMAWGDNFYKNRNNKGNYVHFTESAADAAHAVDDTGAPHYYNSMFVWENPALKLGSKVVESSPMYKPQTVWDKFFANVQPVDATETLRNKTLIDAVLADYRSVLAGSRINGDDRRRLERHMQLISQSEQKVTAANATCDPKRPGAPTDIIAVLQAHNDVIVSLIACGLCNVFLGKIKNPIDVTASGYWHLWSHEGTWPLIKGQLNGIMKGWALDLAQKLDAQGLLDDSLIALPWEHGREGHIQKGIGVVTFGSAGGTFKTGQYVDFRNMEADFSTSDRKGYGFTMNQLWANWLMAMDVPPSEFEPLNPLSSPNFGKTGYGTNISNNGYANGKGANLSDWLPLIKA